MGLFSKKRDGHSNSEGPSPDSTYGSARPSDSLSSNATTSYTDSDPAQRNSGIERREQPTTYVDQNNNVVTTTTTTTTTTTAGGGNSNSVTSSNEPEREGFGDNNTARNSFNNYNTSPTQSYDNPPIPQKSMMRERSPNPGNGFRSRSPNTSAPMQAGGTTAQATQPARANFSYPNPNAPASGIGGESGMGTLQGLKTAAAGIHGAGETLRGTLNASVDKRFHGQGDIVAGHEQVADSGRREIESGRFSDDARERERTGNVGGVLRRVMPYDREGKLRVVNE